MTSRLSYASSPESDLELSPAPPLPGALGPPTRLKSSSDPSIATQDDTAAPPPYTTNYQSGPPQYPGGPPQPRSPHQGPPDLPPRVDRNVKPPNQTQRGTPGRTAQERLANKTDSVLDMGNYINATPHRANTTSSLERAQPKAGSYDSMSSYDSYNNTNGNGTYTATNLNTSTGRLGPNVPDDLKSGGVPVSPRAHDPYRFTRSTAQPIPAQENQTRTDYAKYSRTGDYKPAAAPPQGKPSGSYKPVPPPKPKNYRPPQQPIPQDETNGTNLYQHAKSYSIATSHMHNGGENGSNIQRNSGQYYYNIPPPNRNNEGYNINSNHNHSHSHTSPANHSHSLSHTHPHSSPPMTHSHSNSAGQINIGHGHNRNNVNHNGHSHSNSHGGGNTGGTGNNGSSGHNREPSGLDLAGSREQRGSAFELYRKPLHHHNVRKLGVARGVFSNKGGVLEGPGGVTLTVPPGALPVKSQQEIYFSVTAPRIIETHNTSPGHCSPISPPMNHGESLLSPVVECGPRGLDFLAPVELRIPHNATPAHRLALKATDTENQSNANWLDVKLPTHTSNYVTVRLDHF